MTSGLKGERVKDYFSMSQNHRMLVGRELQDHLVPPPAMSRETLH